MKFLSFFLNRGSKLFWFSNLGLIFKTKLVLDIFEAVFAIRCVSVK